MRAYVPYMVKGKPKVEERGDGTVRLNLTVSESLEREFREIVFKRYGLHKGDIQKAVEEALRLWIAKGV
jgi:hypothetical protein